MPGSSPTFLDLAASIDRVLRRNIQWPLRNLVFADSPVTVTTLDRSIMANAVGGAMVVNLPDATLNKGMFFEVKKTDLSTNTVTVQCTVGGQTIDGAATKVLIAANDFIVVESDGANYKIVALVISSAVTGGAVFYTVKKIYKTDGITTLVPVAGTLINFNVAVDGECFFAATGLFAGFTGFLLGSLTIRVDGVDIQTSTYFSVNGSGGDSTGPITQEPNASLFLTAGPHTVELVASQINISLQASAANPLTLSVLYPAASFNTAAPTPKAATLVVSPVPGIGDFTTIESALAAITVLGGGYILVREGTYTPPVGGYILPDSSVEIIGCGSSFANPATGTFIDLTGFTGNVFNKSFKQEYKIADLTIRGDGSATQNFFDTTISDTSNYVDVENVNIDQVQSGFTVTVAQLMARCRNLTFTPSLALAATFWSGGGTLLEMDMCQIVTGIITGSPELVVTNSDLGCVQSPFVTNVLASARAATSKLSGGWQMSSGKFEGCAFTTSIFGGSPTRVLDFTGSQPTVVGCVFSVQGSAEDIRLAGSDALIDSRGIGFNLKVTETGAADKNCLRNIAFTSTVIGPASEVNNWNLQNYIANITLDEFNRTATVDATGGAVTVALPTAASAKWQVYSVKKTDASANAVSIDPDGAELIDGAATQVLASQYETITFQSDGTTWHILVPLSSGGSSTLTVRAVAVNDNILSTDDVILATGGAGGITLTLPDPATNSGHIFRVKKVDAAVGTVTISQFAAETIDGAATVILITQYQSISLISDTVNWYII